MNWNYSMTRNYIDYNNNFLNKEFINNYIHKNIIYKGNYITLYDSENSSDESSELIKLPASPIRYNKKRPRETDEEPDDRLEEDFENKTKKFKKE
jgi:hypothetical protein